MFRTVLAVLLVAVSLATATTARADWVNLGGAEVSPEIAEFHVEDDGVRLVLEVFVGDLDVFADLVPGAWLKESGMKVQPDKVRLARFAAEGLSIRTDDDVVLPVNVVAIDRRMRVDRASPMAGQIDPYSGRRMPEPPKDPRVMYAELFYPFAGVRPDALTISPPKDDSGGVAATIGVILFHRSVPVIDFRFLSQEARVRLDWDDPWYSRFDNPNLTRHHKYPRMTFLYAEPHEIRHEALVRVRDAMALVGKERNGPKLDDATARELSDAVAAEIGSRTPVTIEGAPVTPDFDRSAFMRIGLRGLEFLQPGEDVDVDADILGLIWSVPTDGLPKQAELEWNWFDEKTTDVAGYAVDAAGPFLYPLTAEDRLVTWTNHFKVNPYPEIAAVQFDSPEGPPFALYLLGGTIVLGLGYTLLVLVGRREGGRRGAVVGVAIALIAAAVIPVVITRQAARVPDLEPEKLSALAGDLLNNVYRAFDFRTEDQVYDRLALTLEGAVLEEVYLAQRDALRIERAGGADARVKALEVTEVEQLDTAEPGMLRLRADWIVQGSVGHWGHVHTRTNAYEADLTLEPVDGTWKIRTFDVISQERLL